MPLSERTKFQAKCKSAFRCCVCHRPFVEIHHLIPQSEGGGDDLANAAPLCSSCHDLYGGNPDKRKSLKQMRDHWWSLMEERSKQVTDLDESPFEIDIDHHSENGLREKGIAIYHSVFENEDFATAAISIHGLVKSAQEKWPNRRRLLFLDIDGHRNNEGGFDNDMFELQRHFILGFLMPYLTEAKMPLGHVKNEKFQRNDIAKTLDIIKSVGKAEVDDAIRRGVETIWLADHDAAIKLPKPR